MDIAVIQTDPADAYLYLRRLQKRLPEGFDSQVVLGDLSPATAEELPRRIALMQDAAADMIAQVQAAAQEVNDSAFELSGGGVPALAPVPEAELATLSADDDQPWANAPLTATAAPDIEAVLRDVFALKDSGEPFPELAYANKEKKAYDYIVRTLGKAPMADQGDTLRPGMVRAIPRPGHRYDRKAWDAVVAHLETELLYFQFAREWFGDAGHLRVLYRDRVVLDHDFMAMLNDRFKLVSDKNQAMIYCDIAMGKVIGAASGGNPGVGLALSCIWARTKEKMPDPQARLKAKIREMRAKVTETFSHSIHAVELAHDGMCKDWGRLRAFSQLLTGAEPQLTWPKDARPLRVAHARAFQYEAMRELVSIKSESTKEGYSHWGVIRVQRSAKKARKRSWDAKKLRLYSASKESCGSHHYYEYFLAFRGCSYVAMAGLVCDPPVAAPKALMKKLFGKATDDDVNPDLAISPDFLDKPKSKARKHWRMVDMG